MNLPHGRVAGFLLIEAVVSLAILCLGTTLLFSSHLYLSSIYADSLQSLSALLKAYSELERLKVALPSEPEEWHITKKYSIDQMNKSFITTLSIASPNDPSKILITLTMRKPV